MKTIDDIYIAIGELKINAQNREILNNIITLNLAYDKEIIDFSIDSVQAFVANIHVLLHDRYISWNLQKESIATYVHYLNDIKKIIFNYYSNTIFVEFLVTDRGATKWVKIQYDLCDYISGKFFNLLAFRVWSVYNQELRIDHLTFGKELKSN